MKQHFSGAILLGKLYAEEKKEETDVKDIYNNRELSWLKFNERVLEEAEDERVPLCERLTFAASSNS